MIRFSMVTKARQATRAQDYLAKFKRGFHWFFLVVSACLLVSLILLLKYRLHRADIYPIREVSIEGNFSHLESYSLQKLIVPFTQTNFFSIDLQGLKEKLLEQPWVAQVEVRRVWPDHLVIHLIEQKPVAIWNGSSLLSNSGIVFAPPINTFPDRLPFFSAPSGQQKLVMQMFQHLSDKVSVLGLTIAELDLTPRLAWYMRLNNGLQVVLGRDQIDQRLQRFIEAYSQLFAQRVTAVDYIDLRYSNGFAVKWRTQNSTG